jgi:hypothetical protein
MPKSGYLVKCGTHKLKLLDVIPGRLLIFTPVSPFQRLFLYRVMFEMEPLGDSATLYRSRVHLRLDAIGSWLFQKYVEAAEIHIEEETENLKKLWSQVKKYNTPLRFQLLRFFNSSTVSKLH